MTFVSLGQAKEKQKKDLLRLNLHHPNPTEVLMNTIDITTKEKPTLLTASISANGSASLYIVAYSLTDPKTVFFDREVLLEDGRNEPFLFRLPVTPEFLRLEWKATSGNVTSMNFLSATLKIRKTPLQEFFESVALAPQPLSRYGFSGIAIETRTDLNGSPARVNMLNGTIEVDYERFVAIPVINRVFRLLHEYAHYYLGRQSETGADSAAYRLYQSWGYPRYSAMEEMEGLPFGSRERIENLRNTIP